MCTVEPRIGPNPDWDAYQQTMITKEEYEAFNRASEQMRLFEDRHRSTLYSLDPKNVAPDPALNRVPTNVSPLEKNYYRNDSISSASSASTVTGNIPLKATASLGTPKITKPEDRNLPKAITQPTVTEPAKLSWFDRAVNSVKAFFTEVKNFFWNLFGWNTTPAADTSADSQLVGSPKEQKLTKQEAELISKALDQLSLAINKLITKPAEESKDLDSEESDKEAEIAQLKQLLTEVQILKRMIDSFKSEVGSKDFEILLASDEINKNYQDGKDLQDKHLKNSEEIEDRMKTSKLLNWVQYGADGVIVLTFLASIAIAVGTGGAGLPVALSLMGGVASVTKGGAMIVNADQRHQTGLKKAENEGHSHSRKKLNDHFDSRISETTQSMDRTLQLYIKLLNFIKNKQKVVQALAQQISR